METDRLRLETPAPELESTYRTFILDLRKSGTRGYEPSTDEATADFPVFVRRLIDESNGLGLPQGHVPQTTYWLVTDERQVVGEIRIRHRLTPHIEDSGGHIGYAVRPSEHRKGFGTRMLAMALQEARATGLHGVLITCESDNLPSARVIQKNGGRFVSESLDRTGRLTSRYWIDLVQAT